jgi:hypothetical protein
MTPASIRRCVTTVLCGLQLAVVMESYLKWQLGPPRLAFQPPAPLLWFFGPTLLYITLLLGPEGRRFSSWALTFFVTAFLLWCWWLAMTPILRE